MNSKVHRVVIHEMRRHYEGKAKLAGIKSPKSGCVAFTQRAGSALNLNPHLHVLMVDGVFVDVGGNPLFRNLSAMTDAEVASLAESISKKYLNCSTSLRLAGPPPAQQTARPSASLDLGASNQSSHCARPRKDQGGTAAGPRA